MSPFFRTDDGSFTYRFEEEHAQLMHNYSGAVGETLHVYGTAIRLALEFEWPARFLIFGTGLGYIELVLAAFLQKSERTTKSEIFSFESNEELVQHFFNWLAQKEDLVPQEFLQAYTSACHSIERNCSCTGIRQTLFEYQQQLLWSMGGCYSLDCDLQQKFSCILFDPFSPKAQPDLWSSENLQRFLGSACAQKAIFATYAANGNLKRALAKEGFKLIDHPGYKAKRESTLAIRSS